MRWTHKALLQRWIAALPARASQYLYFVVQRHLGGLRLTDPWSYLDTARGIADRQAGQGGTLDSAVVLEVGTGRSVMLPIGLWLLGAQRVYTYDLNTYLREELVLEDIDALRRAPGRVLGLLRGNEEMHKRLRSLQVASSLESVLDLAAIEYVSPGDARRTELPDRSIDLHVSRSVLEHIPSSQLADILVEASRLLKDNGLAIHLVDFSDHFSHSDASISAINFLRFSEHEWRKIAGNRFMYHNRLRCDDLVELMTSAGLSMKGVEPTIDDRALEVLHEGFALDRRFARKPPETNATRSAWVVAGLPRGDFTSRL